MADWESPASRTSDSGDNVRLTARVEGMVQGVGFRYRTAMKANQLALTGTVQNNDDGSVAVVAEGPPDAVDELLDWLESPRAPGRVARVNRQVSPASGEFEYFDIVG